MTLLRRASTSARSSSHGFRLRPGFGGQAGGRALLVLVVFIALPVRALGQDGPALRANHFTLGATLVWSGAYDVGRATAQLRGNGPGTAPPAFTLLQADSRVSTATAPQFTVGFALTRTLAIEAGATLAHPRIGVSITGDAEAPSQVLLGEELEQYQFEAGLSWQLPVSVGRIAPFITLGGGHLRQLHEDRTLAETGQIYYAGAGARYWLRGGSASSMALGFRGDVRMNLRRKGIDFENKRRSYPTVSLALFLGL